MTPDEPTSSGWLPPRPPETTGRPAEPNATWERPQLGAPRPYRAVERPPSSPAAVAGIVVGSIGLALLVFTAGTAYLLCGILGLAALSFARSARRRAAAGDPVRPGQIRAATVLGAVVLALALAAAVTWAVLDANGITQQDLRDALERERDRLSR